MCAFLHLGLLGVLLLIGPASSALGAPDPALAGHWTGDEVSGLRVFDASGQGHDGWLYGIVQPVPGRIGRGLRFSEGGYFEVNSDPALDISDQFTIEYWFLPGEVKANYALMSRGGLGESFDIYYGPPGLLNLRSFNFKGPDHVSGPVFKSDQWQHVVWTYDANLPEKSLRLYVDGELHRTWDEGGRLGVSNKPLVIGNGGSLDEIRLYRRALGAEEIARRAQTAQPPEGREVVICSVWPEKLLTRPGQKRALQMAVASLAAASRTVKFRAFLETGLAREIPLREETLALAPGEVKDYRVDWDPGDNRFGFDLVAEVRDEQGRLLDRKSETLLVGKNPYQLGQYTLFASFSWDEEAVRSARRHVVTMRRFYIPLSEYWCINPDNFSKCVPDTDKWFVGMGATAYKLSEATTQALVAACHQSGLGIVPYSLSYASGYYGTRMALEHPEWMAYTAQGRLAGGFETRLLELMTQFYQRYPQSFEDGALMEAIRKFPDSGAGLQICTVNLANREAMRFHAEQVAAGVRHFQWDGLRWDGHPQVGGPGDPITMGVPDLYDMQGKPLVPDAATRDRITVENLKLLKDLVLKENPDAVFGYNWGLEYEKHGRVRPTDYAECCRDGGTILWESINGIGDAGSPWHRWRDLAEAVADEVEHPHQLGGFLQCGAFIWGRAAEPFGKHLLAILFASRARLYAAPGLDSNAPYLRFAARYSELLYDLAVNRSPEWAKAVQVDSPQVWWRRWVYEHPSVEGKQVLVHLVNAPATEFVELGSTTPPTPAKEVKVSVAVSGGQAPRAVFLLSPDREPWSVRLTPAVESGKLKVTVPEVLYWTVLALQF